MNDSIPALPVMILRVVIAAACGLFIGLERQRSHKPSGIKTHMAVAFGAALMMLVSQYGFLGMEKYDASRVAAQVISGVSFLGAGIIMKRQANIEGLSDAATIWCSAGIGLAVGAGMIWLGIISTLLLSAMTDCLRHFEKSRRNQRESYLITVRSLETLQTLLKDEEKRIPWKRIEKAGKQEYSARIQMEFSGEDERVRWEQKLLDDPSVQSFQYLYPTD